MMSLEDKLVHGIDGNEVRVRVYTPQDMKTVTSSKDGMSEQVAIGILFIHGGGGWLGSIETHDCVARRLAAVSFLLSPPSLQTREARFHPDSSLVCPYCAAYEVSDGLSGLP